MGFLNPKQTPASKLTFASKPAPTIAYMEVDLQELLKICISVKKTLQEL